ncbi:MAG: cupredoxin domain-containing protein [Actinomycetota bacterium]
MRAPLALVVALIVLSACTQEDRGGFGNPPPAATAAPSPSSPPLARPVQEVSVTAPGGLRFEPEALEIRSGRPTEFELVNDDAQEHTLVISELAVVMLAAPGQTVASTVAIDPKNQGKFDYFCSVSGHRESGMEGTITVR